MLQLRLKLRTKPHFKNIVYEEEEAAWLDFLTCCSETVLGDFFFFFQLTKKSGGFSQLNLLRECKCVHAWLKEKETVGKKRQKYHFTGAVV